MEETAEEEEECVTTRLAVRPLTALTIPLPSSPVTLTERCGFHGSLPAREKKKRSFTDWLAPSLRCYSNHAGLSRQGRSRPRPQNIFPDGAYMQIGALSSHFEEFLFPPSSLKGIFFSLWHRKEIPRASQRVRGSGEKFTVASCQE